MLESECEEVVGECFALISNCRFKRYSATEYRRCLIFHETGFVAVEQTGNQCAPVVDVGLIQSSS